MMKKSKSSDITCDQVVSAAAKLRDGVDALRFGPAVPWVYNPLAYAWSAHEQYLRKYVRPTCRVLFLGMNPGPWGMAQTGVPFGEVSAVKEWLKIDAEVTKPAKEHPKRPIEGLSCSRSEVSGRRLWGLFQARYESPSNFFKHHFVANYCPLVFMEQSAKNLTPDKLPTASRKPLGELCDLHLAELIAALQPSWIIGVGAFAEECSLRVLGNHLPQNQEIQTGKILHPSPASPAANRDWAGTATRQLVELGVWA